MPEDQSKGRPPILTVLALLIYLSYGHTKAEYLFGNFELGRLGPWLSDAATSADGFTQNPIILKATSCGVCL